MNPIKETKKTRNTERAKYINPLMPSTVYSLQKVKVHTGEEMH